MIVKRDIENQIHDSFRHEKVVVLLGPRQVGKTTLVKEILKKGSSTLYLSLDDMALRRRLEQNPQGLTQIIEEQFRLPFDRIPRGSLVAIDECQKAPLLLDQIKYLYDQQTPPRSLRWILTGSSLLRLRGKTAESLSGRAIYYYLFPFSWHEVLLAHEKIRSEETSLLPLLLSGRWDLEAIRTATLKYQSSSKDLLDILDQVLVFGSFPEITLTPDEKTRWLFLNNYHGTYLERDILQLPQVGDWKAFAQFTEAVSAGHNSPLKISDLCQNTGLARDTVKKYLSILEQSFLLYDIPVFSRSVERRILKASKYEWIDAGLVSLLTKATDKATLKATGAIGARLEGWVISQFLTASKNSPLPIRLSYWRTVSGLEVDLILEIGGKLYPLEIKYTNRADLQDLRGLKAFRTERKKEVAAAAVLYRGPYLYNAEEKIHYLPVWGLF